MLTQDPHKYPANDLRSLIHKGNKKVYISGPMTGIDKLNFHLFDYTEKLIIDCGLQPLNPHKIVDFTLIKKNPTPLEEWVFCMKQDLKELLGAGAVIMLPNWYKSPGSIVEYFVAKVLNIPCITPINPNYNHNKPIQTHNFEVIKLTKIVHVKLLYKIIEKIMQLDHSVKK
jgi:hypothetical protein